jgi:hypothetical protein
MSKATTLGHSFQARLEQLLLALQLHPLEEAPELQPPLQLPNQGLLRYHH